jgi:pimeloyl-ACP methyl ester carboxylesterase
MADRLPILLIPGLNCTARLYAQQIPHLWRSGPLMIADHTCGESVPSIADAILASAPPRFSLVGFSLGGYLAFEILRKAPDRVARLALLDTSARADTAEQAEHRRQRIAAAQTGRFLESLGAQFPLLVGPSHRGDVNLQETYRSMATESGPDTFIRQTKAAMIRPDSRHCLSAIRCPTVIIVGEKDELTPPEMGQEIAAGISQSKLIVVPDSGHLTPLEQPQLITEALITLVNAP